MGTTPRAAVPVELTDIGGLILKRRQELGLTQNEVGLRIGGYARLPYLSTVEGGKSIPSIGYLCLLAEAMECSVHDFIPSEWSWAKEE